MADIKIRDHSKDYLQQLADHIKKNLAKGYTLESLKFALLDQGYTRSVVERAFQNVHKELSARAPNVVEAPVVKTEIIQEPITEEKKPWWKFW